MIESPLIQEVIASQLHQAVIQVLTDRFVDVPDEIKEQLHGIQEPKRLQQMISWAVRCADLADFATHLTS